MKTLEKHKDDPICFVVTCLGPLRTEAQYYFGVSVFAFCFSEKNLNISLRSPILLHNIKLAIPSFLSSLSSSSSLLLLFPVTLLMLCEADPEVSNRLPIVIESGIPSPLCYSNTNSCLAKV